MKTALLTQNEALAAKDYRPNNPMSVLPLSHSVQYPVDIDGAILPCCIIEVNPHESYQLSNEILLRQLQPLKVPQMTRYTLNTAYFYCSNRLGWKKWAMFSDQADKGRSNINYVFELPQVSNAFALVDGSYVNELADVCVSNGTKNVNYKNSLHTYFDISKNIKLSTSDLTTSDGEYPLAFPFFDYQMIVRDFYTNIDRISDTPDLENFNNFDDPIADWSFSNLFPVDEDEIKLQDGVNVKSGFQTSDDPDTDSIKGFVLDKVRYHDFRPDYFTSSKRAPMRGEAPTVDTTIAVSSVDASDVISDIEPTPMGFGYSLKSVGVDSNGKLYVAGNDIAQNYLEHSSDNLSSSDNWVTDKLNGVSGQVNTNLSSVSSQPDSTLTAALKTQLENLKIELSVAKSINCAELMLMTQLTLWQTLNMLSKPTYNDFLNAHFGGVKVGDSLAEAPQYIGGTSQTIDINEVLQTSADSGTQKLGNQAAVAHSYSSSNIGTFFAQDYGFIIGVMYILPDIVYRPAMPRWASRRQIEDYYFPEFANLSMQATLNKELFYSNDKDWNNQALGYVGAYDELRAIPNYCAGLMLDDDGHSDLSKWLVTRKFSNDNKPAINQRFLSAKGNVDKEAWTVPEEPKFMFQCANFVKAARQMPWLAIPKLA